MSRPNLTWTLTFQPGVNNTLSRIPPYNVCTCRFKSDVAYKKFMCRVTKDGDPWGRDIGTLVAEFTNRAAETYLEFEINSLTHMTSEDGLYKFGMYAQSTDGEWNLAEYFLVSSGGFFLVGSNHDKMLVNDGSTPPIEAFVKFTSDVAITVTNTLYEATNLEYSLDSETWTAWPSNATTPSANVLYFRGTGNQRATEPFTVSPTTARVSVSGDIEALLDYDTVQNGNHPTWNTHTFFELFKNCTWLVAAPKLPYTNLTVECYEKMFFGCTNLVSAPKELPASILPNECYYAMFAGCTSLTAPSKFTNVFVSMGTDCCRNMYERCTSLAAIPKMSTTLFNGVDYMFIFDRQIKIESAYSAESPNEYKLPFAGTATQANLSSIFYNTGGSITTVATNTTYYTNMEVI